MKRKIYCNSNSFVLTDCKSIKKSDSFYICNDKSEVSTVISLILSCQNINIEMYNDNFDYLFDMVLSHFKYIEAAGGLVQNEDGNFLYMFRNNMWDLPKGKLDKGETIEQAALREVQEETGLLNVVLNKYLCSTWHIYFHKQVYVLKQTFWYTMTAKNSEILIPQTEEGITELCWFNNAEILAKSAQTYPAIRDVQSAFAL